jgi:hypothetical protein
MLTVKEIVKDTKSKFSFAREGMLYYNVQINDETFQFPINMNDKEDVGTGVFLAEEKSIFFMRWIRKAVESNNFIKIK